ncbi:4Fe-4S dicluster domain-containing protein [Sulfurovum sp. NBC37-1]|uniref:4Fe-4S dicluster domain-containing protein n=1 Tax=Sulfurovum sp. (strain NBC37-1) TaxID=387093 RepID=UPI0001587509|nr:4Fe-4S binding protein [Sulfurovum sp. NBC37-1]BAF71472.1 ferredoxin-like protein [Sulfurovum sp. NBC37-1]
MKLHFDVASCVRAKSKFSECTKCMDICPDSITLQDNLPTFKTATGVEAAACVGVCPTEAFALSDFSTTEFFFTFLESKVRLISPNINVPCLSVLSVEHLISLALASEEPITLDLSVYDPDSILFEHIEKTIDEANFVLSSFSQKQLETNVEENVRHSELVSGSHGIPDQVPNDDSMEEEVSSRRSFLGNVSLKGVVKHKKAFDEAVDADELRRFDIDASVIEKIRDKQLPDKRKILFTTLKRAGVPDVFEVLPEEEISFVSQKYVDENCTNCQICYRICPTGALSSDGKFSLIHFDAMLCLKCRLCHDACEPDAIHLQKGFEIKEFFEPTQRTLATFSVKRCNECGNYFTYTGGEVTCPRCMVEEEEAMFLHENAKKMSGETE